MKNEMEARREPEKERGVFRLTLKMRLSLLLFLTVMPLTGIVLSILVMLRGYSASYDAAMANLKVANEYNLKFKEEMEYSMYRVMIGRAENLKFQDGDFMEAETQYVERVKNPINMIHSARYAFGHSIRSAPGTDGNMKIRGIMSCLDSLEKAVGRIIENLNQISNYDENISIWENDIQGLCSMIQEYITQYTYYEILNMERLQMELEIRTRQLIRCFMVLLTGTLALGFVLSAIITKSVTGPLYNLQRTAERLGRGELESRAEMCSLEEINVLARTFNKMSGEIMALMEKTKEEQRNLREAELKLHQAQINPHFLYNTLDSIVWMAEGGNNRQVVQMTMDLSCFFRTALSGGKDFITVGEEEAHIRSYLKIQKIRYEDILDYEIRIAPAIRSRIMLKMILQPVVENALYHGIKNKRNGGKITICGYEEENGLVFAVEDNGIGMDSQELAALRLKLEEETEVSKSGGFGLNNVAQRIRMYYGSESKLYVESKKERGTCVKVYLRNREK